MPEWLAKLPSDAYINAKEMMVLFGYSPKTRVAQMLKRGSLPPYTARSGLNPAKQTMQWRVGDIRRYIREQ